MITAVSTSISKSLTQGTDKGLICFSDLVKISDTDELELVRDFARQGRHDRQRRGRQVQWGPGSHLQVTLIPCPLKLLTLRAVVVAQGWTTTCFIYQLNVEMLKFSGTETSIFMWSHYPVTGFEPRPSPQLFSCIFF